MKLSKKQLKQKNWLKWFDKIIILLVVGALVGLIPLAFAYNKADKIDNETTYDNSPQNISGLINYMPTEWWRLNASGWAQEYVEMKAPAGEVRLRTRELLNRYGFTGTWDRWDTVAIIWDIKTEFLVCLAKAETTLGKYQKTANNLTNNGNTDSGKTITYTHWIKSIAGSSKTLTNHMLGSYEELRQLSNYGQKGQNYIYASSRDNWHINMRNCLSNIHGYDVGDAYEFRR